jgi:hypothetical protein
VALSRRPAADGDETGGDKADAEFAAAGRLGTERGCATTGTPRSPTATGARGLGQRLELGGTGLI